ncbi:MAG TPA: hypothetical protein VKH41_14615 [Myxococcota bacterium]|nr:hypothetical protein [Myxococcota bacterium]
MAEEVPRPRRFVRGVAAALVLLPFCSVAARADRYDPQRAGHPVRIVAYIVHPIGVMLDLLIFRPAHWIGSQPGLDRFFGHEPYED